MHFYNSRKQKFKKRETWRTKKSFENSIISSNSHGKGNQKPFRNSPNFPWAAEQPTNKSIEEQQQYLTIYGYIYV